MIDLARDTWWRRAAWLMHRASGVGVLLFLLLHVAETSLVRLGPEAYDSVVVFYRQATFRALEILLMGAVLFHAFNGIRITIIDVRADWLRYDRLMLYVVYVLTALLWLTSSYFMATK